MEIERKEIISGRGTVLVCQLKDGDIYPVLGMQVYYKGMVYEVKGIETFKKLTSPPQYASQIGLLVKEIPC